MGNCMETCIQTQQVYDKGQEQLQEEGKVVESVKGGDFGTNGLRIKIVLTKEELEWLLFQLKNKEGKSLEDVLGGIEKGRGKVAGWKPSLESIMESPEVLEMDRS